MTDKKTFNRWLIVVGALLIQLCLGAIYAWSVFRKPLESALNITSTQASLPFSFVLIFFALATVIGGRLQDRFGPRIVAIIGGILLALGMILASFASSIAMLVIAYGIISGIGIGFAYVCPISAGVKWFPDKRGLITGLAVAGFGAGALIVGPLARAMIDSIGPFATFRYLGVVYLILVLIGALILRNPPAGYRPEGWNPPQPAAGVSIRTDYTAGQMLATVQFWLIWLTYFAGCAAGLMIIGQTSPIAQELGGFSKETAALGVSVLAIFNALGRIFWGRISDSLGRTRALFLMFLINAVAILGYFLIPSLPFIFWIGIALVGSSFGGYLAIYPAVTADFYGTKNSGINYGLVFTAYGVGGLLSNIFAPRIKEITGNYNVAFLITALLCIAAGIVIITVKSPSAKAKPV
ncbi:MAG: OFA family MFS transporter [candidate division WOR-3 bacterium]|uniref:MFS transporter n=1 Tax=candidate division WOR-3 bacterium TaxID=2052148 RepID=A0A7C1X1R3_UNCW3|nr:OFA family MFS transporter [candidate division WOR-3 bacterium]